MQTVFDIETDEASYNLKSHVLRIGDDVLVAIYGGDRPHIGAASMSQPRQSLEDPSRTSATASTFCYPDHKEDVLTKEVSKVLSSALGVHVVVVAGVHYDDIDQDGIGQIIQNSRTLTRLILAKLKAESTEADEGQS
jgi:hypothetical protein